MTKVRSKRVQRDKNNKLPTSTRTPGSLGIKRCDGLSSSGANTNRTKTEFHKIFAL